MTSKKRQTDQQFQAIIIDRTTPEGDKAFQNLTLQPGIVVLNTIRDQVAEWIRIKNPGSQYTSEELITLTTEEVNRFSETTYGNWIYYPWRNMLVHVLREEAFIEVRTNRNQLKITREEQATLSSKRIGIIGLSVGQSVALTMAMERTCGELHLADFDTLDLSNMNRIRTGVHQIGLPKTVIAAREIAELDPYLKVVLYNDGITPENLSEFLHGNAHQPLDLLVEVCDGAPVKFMARKAARSLRIPVIMDTNDRGMIDIERFDLDPQRPLLHGLIPDNIDLAALNPSERLNILKTVAGFDHASERLKQSMTELGKSILTWPQLASSVVLGGGATTDIARKILLKQHQQSGRYYVDLDALIPS